MAWLIAITLLIFYALGVWVFHATAPVSVLPVVAVAVLVIDRILVWKYGRPGTDSAQR